MDHGDGEQPDAGEAAGSGQRGGGSPRLADLAEPRISWSRIAGAWVFGVLLLAGIVTFVLHLGDASLFLATLQKANPVWLATAVLLQSTTYFCAAGVWLLISLRAGVAIRFRSLLRLALVELFANQAIPTAGLSGGFIVMAGLKLRGVDSASAVTAVLMNGLSYYAAFLAAGFASFALLWLLGDFGTAAAVLFLAFALLVAALIALLRAASRPGGGWPARIVGRIPPLGPLARLLSRVRTELLGDRQLFGALVGLQLLIFFIDAATLYATLRAVGVDLMPLRVFTAFVLATIAATLSPLPLGLGAFEGGSTALLHLMGAPLEASLAATLLLRGFTLWLPMIPGLWMMRRERVLARRKRPARPRRTA